MYITICHTKPKNNVKYKTLEAVKDRATTSMKKGRFFYYSYAISSLKDLYKRFLI